jgi:hypothetical protein
MTKIKAIVFFASLIVSCLGVRCQSVSSINQIEFTTLTRGYQKHVVLSVDSLIVAMEGRQGNETLKKKLSKGDWNALMGSLKNTKLSEIPELKSPSMKRAFDGAKHSTLTIITSDQKMLTHSFDDEDPHLKLLPLMSAVKKIMESKE